MRRGRDRGFRARHHGRALDAQRAEVDVAARRARRAQARFALTFVAVAGLLFTGYGFPYAAHGAIERWFQAYLAGYARLAGHVLLLFDRSVHIAGNTIAGRYSLQIVKTCDAMEANLLFVAAVLAFPGRWKRKLVAAAVGLTLLVAVNVTRICTLYFVGLYAPRAFEVIHIEIWPLLLIATAAGQFAAWAVWMRSQPPSQRAPVEAS